MEIIAIAAMAKNRVIGNTGMIPWRISEEFKHFKETTLGYPIIMGRVTYLSIGRPLPWRRNIVISREPFDAPWVEVFSNIDSMLNILEKEGLEKIFICGGSQIYNYFFDNNKIDKVILSIVEGDYQGDAFFPEFEAAFHKIDSIQKDGFFVDTFLKN